MNTSGNKATLSKLKKLTSLALAFLYLGVSFAQVAQAQAVPLERDVDVSISVETRTEVLTPRRQAGSGQGAVPGTEAEGGSADAANVGETNGIQALSAGSVTDPEVPLDARNQKKADAIDTDLSSGTLSYSYDIAVPPGRNGLEPKLTLSYTSQPDTFPGIFGYGWSLSIPYIERLNKTGTDKLYTDNYFSSSLDGELVAVGAGEYHAKIDEGTFLKYSFVNGGWVVINKEGMTYTFGKSAAAQLNNVSNTKTYRWMLEEIRDTNNNYVKYGYYKDSGQIYPDVITYTGTGAVDGPFTVSFMREIRPDTTTVYLGAIPITTKYRIREITTSINGVWNRKYALAYTTGSNGYRSLLASIAQTGRNDSGIVTAMPPVQFSYTQNAPGWINDTSRWISSPAVSQFSRVGDFNGDAYPDFIVANDFSTVPGGQQTLLAEVNDTRQSWHPDVGLYAPVYFNKHESCSWNTFSGQEQGISLPDINGDLFPDIVQHLSANSGQYTYPEEKNVFLGSGSGWISTPNLIPGLFINQRCVFGLLGNFTDLNADGLADLVVSEGASRGVEMNRNGILTSAGTSWLPSGAMANPYGQFLDVNSDGTADYLYSMEGAQFNDPRIEGAFLGTGDSAWVAANNWMTPHPFTAGSFGSTGVRFVDINADGLVDIVKFSNGPLAGGVTYLNTGSGWIPDPTWNLPTNVPIGGAGDMYMLDVNADGLIDFINPNAVNPLIIRNIGTVPDLLSGITTATGGMMAVTYKASSQYRNSNQSLSNPELPLIVQTVGSITATDPVSGLVATDTYTYSGGKYFFQDALNRRFSGFASVAKTDAAGNTTTTYFHQGDASNTMLGEHADGFAKIGRPYRTELRDAAKNLYTVSVTKWDKTDLVNGGMFVYPVRSTELAYDGNATHKDKAETYVYNTTTGNMTSKTEYGEVIAQNDGSFADTGTDAKVTTVAYTKKSGVDTAFPSVETIADMAGVTIGETRHFYDSLALGTVSKGNETKTEHFDGTAYISEQKVYSADGLVTSAIDPRGKITGYWYDAPRLYPSAVRNPLQHTTTYIYDYASGKPKQMTNPNGYTTRITYDGLGRALKEEIPDPTGYSSFVTKSAHVYTDIANAVSVKKTSYLDTTNAVDSHQYFDGLGRLIQERTEAESLGVFNARDIVYNNIGSVAKGSLPYASSGSARTGPTSDPTLYTNYIYDPLQRVLSATNALGTTSSLYDDWTATATDANGKQKVYYKDAYGNLTRVEEKNLGVTYATNYAWNLNGNLIKITDALGNIRNFTYDLLGRRTQAEDLHAPADTTFGVYSYAYDSAGNVTKETTPNGVVIIRMYDDLNRTIKESGTAIDDILYVYDTCANGKGYLCSASVYFAAITRYTYDRNANVASEIVTVNGKSFTTAYGYDRQGTVVKIITPDLAETRHGFNVGGKVEKIDRKETTVWVPVVTNIDYSPTGQIATIAYANGAVTTNTYDAGKLYRLANKKTVNTAGVKLQDISYIYDAVGNITKLVDASATNTGKTAVYAYDDLHRLTSATVTGTANNQNYTETYAYDALGSLTAKNGVPYAYTGTATGNYANPHAATKIGVANLAYDKNGNVLSDGTLTNTWNYRNQIATTKVGTVATNNFYDHNGIRARTLIGTTNTYYPNRYYMTNDNNVTKTKYVYTGGALVATVENGVPQYVATDHLGGTNIITDATGTKIELLDYLPYGSVRLDEKAGTFETKRGYIGEYFDKGTKLNYLNARYYEGTTGRFISQDPSFLALGDAGRTQVMTGMSLEKVLMDPQLLNSYSYARNNPILYTDSTGRFIDVPFISNSPWVQQGASALYDQSAVWRYSMDNPEIAGAAVGLAGGVAFAVGATVATGASLEYASGWGTQSMGNLTQLSSLPLRQHAIEGFSKLEATTGQTSGQILQQASKVGKSFVDYANKGNINTFIEQSAGKLTRVTTNPEITRIISAGTQQVSKVANQLQNGRLAPLSQSQGLSGLVRGIINSLTK